MMIFEPLFISNCLNAAYWSVAIGMSTFWGYYGIIYEKDNNKKEEMVCELACCDYAGNKPNPHPYMTSAACFLSDFAWSFIGWCALYMLMLLFSNDKFDSLNIFLGIIAVVGITGYGSMIPEKIKIG